MSNRGTTEESSSQTTHTAVAETFVNRARTRFGSHIEKSYVFGSTVRGEARGLASDVDVLVVLAETAEQDSIADELRDLAYDVMLEYGPVVEVHILTEREFERSRTQGNPFVRNVVEEGRLYG